MTYQTAESMILTRNCYNLITSDAVEPIGLLKSKITYVNGCSTIMDLATGIVTPISAFKQRTPNTRSDNPDEYVYTPVYFADPDPEVTESLYRQGRVHILNSLLSDFHRYLFDLALHRASEQYDCELSEAKVEVHHLDRNRQNNSIVNLLPVTKKEHGKIHSALYKGASTYEALVYALGEELVHSIYGTDYFDYGNGGGVYTASICGVPYAELILTQLSNANLPAETKCLQVKTLSGKHAYINIERLNIYEILSALYLYNAVEIIAGN